MIEAATPASAGQLILAQWRRWRAPALIVAIVLLGGLVIALVQTGPSITVALDPRDTGPAGAHAIVALLDGRGQRVTRVETAAAAVAQARLPGTTLVVTSPGLLNSGSLATLARSGASLLLVGPDRAALSALAPRVALAGDTPTASLPAMCALPAARLAGSASMGGLLLRTDAPGAWRCYPPPGGLAAPHPPVPAAAAATPGLTIPARTPGRAATAQPPGGEAVSLVRYSSGRRTVTVLGTGAPLTNQDLGRGGNAALALDLLNGGSRVVWLAPGPLASAAPSAGGPRSVGSLIPRGVYLVALELAVAVALLAGWRIRRFGPLVPEPLPIVVRASETVRGHGRLYRARRARGRAGAALRAAALSRITIRLGLPNGLAPTAVGRELADRTGRDPAQVQAILFGPDPADDAALVALAADLDTLEGQVLTR